MNTDITTQLLKEYTPQPNTKQKNPIKAIYTTIKTQMHIGILAIKKEFIEYKNFNQELFSKYKTPDFSGDFLDASTQQFKQFQKESPNLNSKNTTGLTKAHLVSSELDFKMALLYKKLKKRTCYEELLLDAYIERIKAYATHKQQPKYLNSKKT